MVILSQVQNSGDAALAYLVLAIAGMCLALAFGISLIRWVLRINTIVAKQEETNRLLGQILTHVQANHPAGTP